jgi:hypothetical protein
MAVTKQIIEEGDRLMNRIKGLPSFLVAYFSLMSPGHTTIIPYPGPLAMELSDLLRAIESFEA